MYKQPIVAVDYIRWTWPSAVNSCYIWSCVCDLYVCLSVRRRYKTTTGFPRLVQHCVLVKLGYLQNDISQMNLENMAMARPLLASTIQTSDSRRSISCWQHLRVARCCQQQTDHGCGESSVAYVASAINHRLTIDDCWSHTTSSCIA